MRGETAQRQALNGSAHRDEGVAEDVGESDLEVMLADYLTPPYPAWSVQELRRILQPESRAVIGLIELQPECHSYDARLGSATEVAHAG